MPVPDGELHRVLFVDGIWLAERLVVLICCSGERVVSWYMAESENSRAWSALMEPIPAPDVVVTDGGGGFAKAVRATWPRTLVRGQVARTAFAKPPPPSVTTTSGAGIGSIERRPRPRVLGNSAMAHEDDALAAAADQHDQALREPGSRRRKGRGGAPRRARAWAKPPRTPRSCA